MVNFAQLRYHINRVLLNNIQGVQKTFVQNEIRDRCRQQKFFWFCSTVLSGTINEIFQFKIKCSFECISENLKNYLIFLRKNLSKFFDYLFEEKFFSKIFKM